MNRLTHFRNNGIKTGYWSPNNKETLIQRLAEYENTGLEPEEIMELRTSKQPLPGERVFFAFPDQGIVTDDVIKDVGTRFLIFEDYIEPIENLGTKIFRAKEKADAALARVMGEGGADGKTKASGQ